jgi:hypothetical protein
MSPQRGYLAGAAHQNRDLVGRAFVFFLFVVFRWGTARRGLLMRPLLHQQDASG